MMPPASSQPKAAGDRAFRICVKASTHTQPMAIYSTEENHLGQVIQNSFRIMPAMAMPQTMAQRVYPTLPPSTIRHTGV